MVLQFILSNHSCSQSGIPNNAGPFPASTKKLHQNLMPLLIVVTLNMPIFGIHELFYAHNSMFLSMDLFRSAVLVIGKNILNVLMGIKLHLVSASVLYSYIIVVWLLLVFSFAIMTNLTLWKLKIFDLTTSESLVETSVSLAFCNVL